MQPAVTMGLDGSQGNPAAARRAGGAGRHSPGRCRFAVLPHG